MNDVDLFDDISCFVHQLDEKWHENRTLQSDSGNVFTLLDSFFNQAHNPFISFLDLVECLLVAPVRYQSKLCDCVWKHFPTWLEEHFQKNSDVRYYDNWLSPIVMQRAADVSLKNKMKYFATACSLFRFFDHPHESIVSIFSRQIEVLAAKKKYRAVANIIDHNCSFLPLSSLLSDETLRELALFLICKKESTVLKKILENNIPTDRLNALLSFLDSLIGAEIQDQHTCAQEGVEEKGQSGETKEMDEFLHSSMVTILTKLSDELNISMQFVPNVTYIRLREITHFLVEATFGSEAEMDLITFRESVQDCAKLDQRYSNFLVNYLIQMRHFDQAKYFAEEFGLTEVFKSNFSEVKESHHLDTESSVKGTQPFYQLPLSAEAVFFIDNVDKYRSAMNHIFSVSRKENVFERCVGIDSEWQATLLPGQRQAVSIIQLALIDRVLIIDMQTLSRHFDDDDWLLLKRFLESSDVIKVSFAFKSDISALERSFPKAFCNLKMSLHADLEQLVVLVWKSLKAMGCGPIPVGISGSMIDVNTMDVPSSLSDLAQVFLGRAVSKRVRLSNWSRRPLCKAQLQYAAVDAYCLLEIFREMKTLIIHKNIKSPNGMLPIFHDPVILGQRPLTPAEVRLLCDTALADLGAYLRQLKFDVKVASEQVDQEKLVMYALSEKRLVLTADDLHGHCPQDHVIKVSTGNVIEQAEFIGTRLNVNFTVEEPKMESNAIQRVHQLAAHLPDRGIVHYDAESDLTHANDEPPFTTVCRVVLDSGKVIFSKAIAASKHEAKRRAACNMLVKLAANSDYQDLLIDVD